MRIRGIRGAITVGEDRREAVVEATTRLLRAILDRNALEGAEVVSVIFTATEDLRSAFPAEAARAVGLHEVPVLCTKELSVDGALPMVVRVLVHAYLDRPMSDVEHVYLEGASELRRDLR
ncbi:MAG: chorismate mutase [Actinomycetota bacterium]